MAYILTYNEIVDNIQSFCQRKDTDFVNKIPLFVALAMNRISKDLEILGAVQVNQGTLIPNVAVMQKPSLWMNNVNFSIFTNTGFTDEVFLEQRKYETAILNQPDASQLGQPLFYSDYDTYHWLITPTPDQAYPYQISYFRRFEPLDLTHQTNWLTENDPESIQLCCLLYASIWTANQEYYTFLKGTYLEAISSLVARDKSRQTDRFSQGDKV